MNITVFSTLSYQFKKLFSYWNTYCGTDNDVNKQDMKELIRDMSIIPLSLQGELSHGEGALLLLLAQSLLSSLHSSINPKPYLLLGEGTTHSTGGLAAEISRHKLGLGKVLLKLGNEPV